MIGMVMSGFDGLLSMFGTAARVGTGAALAVRSSAEKGAEAMREAVPVDQGELRDSIEVEHSGLSAEFGPTAEHGRFMEYGTYKDAPQPFAEESVESGADDLENALLILGALT